MKLVYDNVYFNNSLVNSGFWWPMKFWETCEEHTWCLVKFGNHWVSRSGYGVQ